MLGTLGLRALRARRTIFGVDQETVVREELRAAIQARRELGEEMEPAVIDAFVARIEQRLGDRGKADEAALKRRRDHQKEMILGSMGISVPLFCVAAVFTGLPGVLAVLIALVALAVITTRQP